MSKKRLYWRDPLSASKHLYARKPFVKSHATKVYYVMHRDNLCALRRDKYALAEPLHYRKEVTQKVTLAHILENKEARDQLVNHFKSEYPTSAQSMSSKMLRRAVFRIAASKLLAKVFQVRRKHVGNLLGTCRSIKKW